MNKYFLALFFLSALTAPASPCSRDVCPKDYRIDALHYRFTLLLNDTTDLICGTAEMTFKLEKGTPSLVIDLNGLDENGTGMVVESIRSGQTGLHWHHESNRLTVDLSGISPTTDTVRFAVTYSGIPSDGLIISKNRSGERTFFGDNWPDRARNWLPCIDHPSDKATVEFIVQAPEKYKVVSNGVLQAEYPLINPSGTSSGTNTGARFRLTHWKEEVPIPTKVMVIGVADFAWQTAGVSQGVPVQSWIFSSDREKGFLDYQPAVSVMDYFQDLLGPYSYEKLANVQSKTIYGGMENSGCIFYHEGSVTGKNQLHSLLAHEIAHQWFGDAVTESDWHHVWLSEGFATYLEACYADSLIPDRSLSASMGRMRTDVISFYKRRGTPVIDTTIADLKRLLNTNSYQKGAWVLHMLRQDLGEVLFWTGIRKFYADYRDRNALTKDFMGIMEEVSGRDLGAFFHQWLEVPGQPMLGQKWKYNASKGEIHIEITQSQDYLFTFPLTFKIKGDAGVLTTLPVLINSRKQVIIIPLDFKPSEVVLDPGINLLFENI